jgi:hypothetical protein
MDEAGYRRSASLTAAQELEEHGLVLAIQVNY